MKKIITQICGGGAKSLKYLLAGMLVFAAAQTAQAAYWDWKGKKDATSYFDDSGCWYASDSSAALSGSNHWFGYGKATVANTTVTSRNYYSLSGAIIIKGKTINFVAEAADKGINSSANIEIGNAANATAVFKSGTYKFNSVLIGQSTSGKTGTLQINGGTFSTSGDVKMGSQGNATLTVNGGTMTVATWTRFENSSKSKTINLNGGTLETYYINSQGTSGSQTVLFNGGTLKNRESINYPLIHANIAVKVGANGGTINANNFNTTVEANFSDNDASTPGSMKFCGGGAVTLTGTIGYTGATTLDAGTAIGVTSANKAGLLANLTVAIPAAGAADGTIVLTNTTDAAVFDQSDIAAITLTGTQDGRYALVLADEGKTIKIADTLAGEYVWNGGNIGAGWKDAGKWSKNGNPGNWHDSTAAVFADAGDLATIADGETVTAASLEFRANATVGGEGSLTVLSSIAVRNGVSAVVNAPTAGALVKEGPGTLTLGAARSDQTTLSDGTLVMSGDGTTLDWTKFTFGTDPMKPVTLKFVDGATFVNISPMPVIFENMDITLVKECGDWNVTGNFQFPYAAGMTAKFYHKGGTLTASNYLVFGDNKDARPTYAEISGGTVQCSNATSFDRMIIASSCDATVVVTNSGTLATAGNLLIANTAVNGTLTVEDGGTVDVAGDVVFGNSSADANGVINLNGGVLSAKMLKRNKECSPKLNFNGGTLKAKADGDLIYTTALAITAGDEGGVIDANGKAVTLKSAISGTGGMTFKGGGTVTLTNNTYTGVTTVEVGTTIKIAAPTYICGGLAVTLPVTAPASGIYNLVTVTGEGTFDESVLAGIVHPTGILLRLSYDAKTIRCFYGSAWIGGASGSLGDAANWADNAVPVGGACYIGNYVGNAAASLTNPEGSTFAPSSITFTADSAAITIDGDAEITGIAAVTNLSTTVSHTINVPVRFTGDIRVKQAADYADHIANSHIVFAGGAYAGAECAIENGATVNWSRCMFGEYNLASTSGNRWTVPNYSNCRLAVADNSTLYIPYAGRLTELDIRANATVFVGDMVLDGRFMHNMGSDSEVIVTNLSVTGSDDRYVSYNQGTSVPGVFKFETVTNSLSGKWFYFADANTAAKHVFYIGAGGLNFSSEANAAYCLGRNSSGNLDTIRPWYSDFTIEAPDNGNRGFAFDNAVEICTDDESNTGRTITLNAKTYARNNPTITVSGSGTLKVNNTNDNAAQPTITVTNTATLAFAAGASLGTGPLVLGTGTTLVIASDDLPISVASLTLPESGTATIQITGDAALADGDYEIIASGAILPTGFAEKINLVLPDGTITTRRLYTSDGGTLKLFIGDGDLPDPYTWTGEANDGKMNTPGNWRGNAVPPVGAKVIIPPTAGELDNNIEGFAPASITFGYGDGAVTIGGNAIAGIAAITNNSTATHTINVPVAFADKILVVQGAMSWEQKANPSIRFAGGVTGTTFADGTARYLNGAFDLTTGADWVANTQGSNNRWGIPAGAWLTTPESTDTYELNVGDASDVGAAFTTGVHRTSSRICCYNYGEYVVTNELVAAYSDDVTVLLCGYDNISNGKFKFEKVTLDKTSNAMFKFGNSNSKSADTGTQQFYIGNGGLCFADGAHQTLRYEAGGGNSNNAKVRIDPWHGDYTIHTKEAADPTDFTVSVPTYFGTTDEGGNACTVTDDGVIASYANGDIHIDGKGTFVVNAVGKASCAVTVHGSDGATLAINPEKKLTTGAMTVNSNATLKVAQSGTVTLGGNLTLKNNACLGFNFTGLRDTMPQLALASGKTLSFSEGATTNITVKVSGNMPKGGTKTLTSCGGFKGVNVRLADGAPEWVEENSLNVDDDGNIVLTVKPLMTMILVR